MSWIESVPPERALGLTKDVYDAALRRAGRIFQIVRCMSLRPAAMEAAMQLYVRVMHGREGLVRRQREMLAIVVSRANECHY